MNDAQNQAGSRLVLLGASNLAIGLRHALGAAGSLLGTPLDVLAALGRARSYGAASSFLVRRMPGIDACGLWAALGSGGDRPTWALVTDVGNDLPFGAAPRTILSWVEGALERLEAAGARTVITSLPLGSLQRRPAWELELWRRLIFPLHGTPSAALLAGALEVDEGLRRLAHERGHTLVELRAEWYGADPIHIRRARRAEAWQRILSPWGEQRAEPRPVRLPPARRLVPERRWVLGREGGCPQPCARLPDGSTLALY